jgi:hypothetical protein
LRRVSSTQAGVTSRRDATLQVTGSIMFNALFG